MSQKTIVAILFLVMLAHQALAQGNTQYPKGDFINPLDIPLKLAGNFGELRGNHFHSGFDFKTNGKEGLPVKAIADGYISRIKVSAYGYGNALYITHKNGYVSVYGHLQQYDSIISHYIKKKQYELELFEVDLFPKKNELAVVQGQIIALSGNTGGSEGPHLHFEIRSELTEDIINPYYFGFEIEDSIPPSIEGVAIYPIDANAKINGSNKVMYYAVKKLDTHQYTLSENITLSGKIGFGIITYDIENGGNNKNGTFSYNIKVDSNQLFSYVSDQFAFIQTRYINAHIDYSKFKKSNDKYQRCYVLPGNKLKEYTTDNNKGVYDFNDTLNHKICIEVSDFELNKSTFELNVKSLLSNNAIKEKKSNNYFPFNKVNQVTKDDFKIEFPTNCFYDDLEFKYLKTARTGNLLSDVHQVQDSETPVHNAYTLSIKPIAKALKFKDKLLIVSIDEDGNPSSEGGTFENGFVVTKIRSFGKFAVMIDSVPPTAKLLAYDKKKSIFMQNEISVKIGENLSGIQNYSATIDGNWVLMQHDNKEKKLTYFFDEKLVKANQEHIFVLTIIDKKGNAKKLSAKFIY